MNCEESLLSGRDLAGSDMVNVVCMFRAGDCGCVSAVREAICINQGTAGEYRLSMPLLTVF